MLSQCKEAIDNPTALFARITRCELSVWRDIRESRQLKNVNFGGYSRCVNQSGACSSSDVITSGGRKSETTMEDKLIVVVCGYLELYDTTSYFYKNMNTFSKRLELPGRSPSHDANPRLLCSEFHARLKRLNSKCSSVQLRMNSTINSLHSHLVWTHLKSLTVIIRWRPWVYVLFSWFEKFAILIFVI